MSTIPIPNPRPTPVDQAATVLSRLGVLDREQASKMLDTWQFTPELTERERGAVIDRFPAICAHCGYAIMLVAPEVGGPRVWRHTNPDAAPHGWTATKPRTAPDGAR